MLKSAALGTPVRIDGPSGLMVLHEDATRPAVFLAGGIGVTPFLSIRRMRLFSTSFTRWSEAIPTTA